jgi:predicted ATPase
MVVEPGSALSPARQVEFLKLLRRMDRLGQCQVIMATQNDPRNLPILMAYPGARLLGLTKYGLDPVTIEQTQHFRLIREFCLDPATFVETMIEE